MIYMINPSTNHFYWLDLQQDLFGDWCIRQVSGTLRAKHKHEVWKAFSTKQEASQELNEIEYLKRQRGYVYADIQDPEHYHLRPQTFAEVI